MLVNIQAILSEVSGVLAAILDGVADVATMMVGSPIIVIGLGLTFTGMAIHFVRRFLHN